MANKILKFKVVFTLHKLEIETSTPSPEILIAIQFGGHDTRSRKFKSREKVFILQESLSIVTEIFKEGDGKLQPKPCNIELCFCEGEKTFKAASVKLDLAKALKMPPKIECGRFSSKRVKGLLLYELSFKQISEEKIPHNEILNTHNKQNLHQDSELQYENPIPFPEEKSPQKPSKMGILDKDEVESEEGKGDADSGRRSIRSETPVFEVSNPQMKTLEDPNKTTTIKKDSNLKSELLEEELAQVKESLESLKKYSALQEKASSKSVSTLKELENENHSLKDLAIRMEEELNNKGLIIRKLKNELKQSQKEIQKLEKQMQNSDSFHKNYATKQSESLSSSISKTRELHHQLSDTLHKLQSEIAECLRIKEDLESDESGLAVAQLSNHLNRAANRCAEMETQLIEEEGSKGRSLTEEMYKRKWQEAENEVVRLKTRISSIVNAGFEYGNEEFLEFIRNQAF